MTDASERYSYDDLRGRLVGVLIRVEGDLRPFTRDFAAELLDHNELGLALEVMVEELAEWLTPVGRDVIPDLEVSRGRWRWTSTCVRPRPGAPGLGVRPTSTAGSCRRTPAEPQPCVGPIACSTSSPPPETT